jgi:hypothetical protein
MFLRGFRRRTGKPIPELAMLFRSIVTDSRDVYPAAADFLNHFMVGAGAPKKMSLRWLRSFKVIKRAERKNQRRFERRLGREAKVLREGASTWVHDHWDARINAFIGTELFYVSRMSQLRSTGSFTLIRTGPAVRLSGTVRHHWFDPYDWDRGRWVYIPRHGFVPIAVGRDLADSDEARNFLMESRHIQTLAGTWEDAAWPRRGKATFEWSLVESEHL